MYDTKINAAMSCDGLNENDFYNLLIEEIIN